jgi:cation:H+ antiporter
MILLIKNIGLLILGFLMLIKGADWLVEGASGIAKRLGIPALVVGLTIVAMGTSAPEAAVSITSALKGSVDIAVGNVLGSNILNVLIILGVTSCITPLLIKETTVKYELPFMIAVSIIFSIIGLQNEVIGIKGGLILWALFIAYLSYLFIMTKKGFIEAEEEDQIAHLRTIPILLFLTVIGIAIVVLGSNFAVDGASGIAKYFGVSERIIGLTIVALGTSLPELVTSVTAAKRGKADIAIGNIVGSNIFNILFVIGTSAIITPVAYQSKFIIDSIVAIGGCVLLYLCVFKDHELSRWGGITMLIAYAIYFVYLML